jgi:hypothetical protein
MVIERREREARLNLEPKGESDKLVTGRKEE